MIDFIKKNIFIGFIFLISLTLGFVTFLTFIDKSFLKLTDQNLQLLLTGNIILLFWFPPYSSFLIFEIGERN